jgi:SAM-dependent methyltransferase
MSEITHGVRAVLSHARIYDLFMKIMGVGKARSFFSSKYIRAQSGDRILDIGCGTAESRNFLPDVEYYGIDPNPRYIKAAQARFNHIQGCSFLCTTIEQAKLDALPKFDIVLAIAVLHHLDDRSAIQLAKLAKLKLKDKGRLILVDTCFVAGQPPIARFLASMDRGKYVRNADDYMRIVHAVFDNVNSEIRHDLMRFSYTHLIMECIAK